MDAGLSFKTTFGNVLTLTPPLTLTQDEMAKAIDIIDVAIGDVAREHGHG
jgi:4-aminobutyrate aminotransferase